MYMDYEKVFGWGVAIYAIMFLFWSTIIVYGIADGLVSSIAGLVVLIFLMYRAGRALKAHAWPTALPYAIGWIVTVAALDSIVSVPFAGWGIFLDPNLWISYAVILIVPLLTTEQMAHALRRGGENARGA